MYLLNHRPDRVETTVIQYLHWPGVGEAVLKEVKKGDTCQRTKLSTTKYGKVTAKLAEKITWNKLYVYLIGPYKIFGKEKHPLELIAITTIDP